MKAWADYLDSLRAERQQGRARKSAARRRTDGLQQESAPGRAHRSACPGLAYRAIKPSCEWVNYRERYALRSGRVPDVQ